jgi:hypothetical protein
MANEIDRRLWQAVLGLLILVLMGMLALIVALALGWNSPRPTRPPDWQAPDLPRTLVASPNETTVSLLGHPSSDFTLEVEATPHSGLDLDGYGLVYRAQDTANYYAFAVGSDGYYAILRVQGGQETELVGWQQFPHIRRGEHANRLRVTCVGTTCHFTINDERTISIQDETWITGDVGLWVHSFGNGDVTVQFSRAFVWLGELRLPTAARCLTVCMRRVIVGHYGRIGKVGRFW